LNYFCDLIRDTNPDLECRQRVLNILKSFYALLKISMNDVIQFIFIVGVLPMALADISGSFNIYKDITFDKEYAEVFGITLEELKIPLSKSVKDPVRINQYLNYFRQKFNGYYFVKNQNGLLCTNLAISALHDITCSQKIQEYPNSEPNQHVIKLYIEITYWYEYTPRINYEGENTF